MWSSFTSGLGAGTIATVYFFKDTAEEDPSLLFSFSLPPSPFPEKREPDLPLSCTKGLSCSVYSGAGTYGDGGDVSVIKGKAGVGDFRAAFEDEEEGWVGEALGAEGEEADL
jgi:hypothetical protein